MEQSETASLDRTFRALGDATRRHIWVLLGEQPGAATSELSAAFPWLSRWAVMKHLSVLREAGLIQTLPRGPQRAHYRIDRGLDDARAWFTEAAPPSERPR